MNNEIIIQTQSPMEKAIKEPALKTLAKNLSGETLSFLTEISQKPNADQKISANKTLIKAYI